MRFVIKKIGKQATSQNTAGEKLELKDLQEIVGGYIDIVGIGNGFGIVCNDSGKLIGLLDNIIVKYDADNCDIIAGNIAIVKYNTAGDEVSMTEEEADAICKELNDIRRCALVQFNGNTIDVLPVIERRA